jgi:hypothetical protein
MVGLSKEMCLKLKHQPQRSMRASVALAPLLIFLLTAPGAHALTTSSQVQSAKKPAAKTTATKTEVHKAPATKPTTKSPAAKPDILFEGYSKIMLGDKHIGYTIQRFEFDPKKKEYSTVYYLKTSPPANDVIESLKARSTYDLKPISYQYTSLAGGRPHIVDASFTNGTMTVTELVNGKRTTKAPVKVPPGTFLSSFLGYLMLQQKEAVKVGNKYAYQAIAEEDGNLYKGEAFIKAQEQNHGLNTYRILNNYKGVQFVSFMTSQGEVIATESAAQGISTELVSNIQEATKGQSVNSNQLMQLFGTVPKGQDNAIARKSHGEPLGAANATNATSAPNVPVAPGAIPMEPATAPSAPKPSEGP